MECHTHIMLLSTWVFGASYAYIPIVNTYTRDFTFNNQTYYECSYDNDISTFKRRFFMSSNMLLTFLLPLCVLILTYSAIMRKLLNDQRPPKAQYRTTTNLPSNNNNNSSNSATVTRTQLQSNGSLAPVTAMSVPSSNLNGIIDSNIDSTQSNRTRSIRTASHSHSPSTASLNGSSSATVSWKPNSGSKNILYSPDSSPKDSALDTQKYRKSFGQVPELRRSVPLNHRSKVRFQKNCSRITYIIFFFVQNRPSK